MTEQLELDPVACFLTACEIERREQRNVRRERNIVNGRLVSAERGRFFYRFDLQGEGDIREDSSLQLIIGDAFYHGSVHAVSKGGNGRRVTIALATNVGTVIPSARVESQEQDLLQSLILRLKDIQRSGGAGLNLTLANQVLRLQPEREHGEDNRIISGPQDLTEDQLAALARCVSEPVTYVWGPPGTGKTVLLAALAWQLYQENKRVLIVSHTNHAVDGVVENLCRRITERGRSTIPEGSILRVGTIVKNSLLERFGEQVCLEAVINRNHEKVSGRLNALSRELAEVRDELFSTSKRLSLLDTYQQLSEEIARVRNGDWFADASSLIVRESGPFVEGAASDARGSPNEYIGFMEETLSKVASELQGCDRGSLEERSVELSGRQLELSEAISVLRKFIRDLRLSLLDRARIVATTATHAMLSARDIHEFDAVLIDEASMLPLPLCYLLSGRARERVVVAGDFRQLPAISRSDSQMVKLWYTRDIFECAGVVDLVEQKRMHQSVVVLTTQFRSHETLCELVNNRFYGGILQTRTDSSAERLIYRDPLAYLNRSPIVVVDTSELDPWGEYRDGSKQNLIHALVARKLALLLSAHGMALLPESLGMIVPYRAQADLIRSLLEESCTSSAVSVGTVHKFQGSEREAIILDLTESAPHALGAFLNPSSLRDTGARLLNVALSRARRHLFVVVNRKHLRAQLSMRSLMWGVLDDLERQGYYLPAARIIGEPIFATPSREVCDSPGVLAFQAFDESLFLPALVTDLISAISEVVIATPRIGQSEVTWIAAVLEERIKRGLRVVIRVGQAGASRRDALDESDVARLRRIGVVMVASRGPIPPAVVIDSEVVWVGSLAPLDSLSKRGGVMARTVSTEAAIRTLEALERDDVPQDITAKVGV